MSTSRSSKEDQKGLGSRATPELVAFERRMWLGLGMGTGLHSPVRSVKASRDGCVAA
jgi:hypothetical protein